MPCGGYDMTRECRFRIPSTQSVSGRGRWLTRHARRAYHAALPLGRRAAACRGGPARGGEVHVIHVRLKRGETVERALKRLKKIMDKEGLMKQLRANRYFEKPSEKQRRKAARARARSMARRG